MLDFHRRGTVRGASPYVHVAGQRERGHTTGRARIGKVVERVHGPRTARIGIRGHRRDLIPGGGHKGRKWQFRLAAGVLELPPDQLVGPDQRAFDGMDV